MKQVRPKSLKKFIRQLKSQMRRDLTAETEIKIKIEKILKSYHGEKV
ncbi:MAG: hypothetical protein M1505_01930 [Patescibacteria group bacterium]|nr:hypothetical protein [Patescibacteria group bacterium]